jgi:hypothetical protein
MSERQIGKPHIRGQIETSAFAPCPYVKMASARRDPHLPSMRQRASKMSETGTQLHRIARKSSCAARRNRRFLPGKITHHSPISRGGGQRRKRDFANPDAA